MYTRKCTLLCGSAPGGTHTHAVSSRAYALQQHGGEIATGDAVESTMVPGEIAIEDHEARHPPFGHCRLVFAGKILLAVDGCAVLVTQVLSVVAALALARWAPACQMVVVDATVRHGRRARARNGEHVV